MKPNVLEPAQRFVDIVRTDAGVFTLGHAPEHPGGEVVNATPLHALESAEVAARRAALQRAISAALHWQRRLIFAPIALIVSLHLAALVTFLRFSLEPSMVVALFAAVGLSLTLPIRWLLSVTRELWNVELLAVSIVYASDDELAAILDSVLRMHSQSQRHGARL